MIITGVKTTLLVNKFQRMCIFMSINEKYSNTEKTRDVFGGKKFLALNRTYLINHIYYVKH